MSNYHYIYLLTRLNGPAHGPVYYIGLRSTELPLEQDDYFEANRFVNRDVDQGCRFEKQVLAVFKTRGQAVAYEAELSRERKIESDPRYYNIRRASSVFGVDRFRQYIDPVSGDAFLTSQEKAAALGLECVWPVTLEAATVPAQEIDPDSTLGRLLAYLATPGGVSKSNLAYKYAALGLFHFPKLQMALHGRGDKVDGPDRLNAVYHAFEEAGLDINEMQDPLELTGLISTTFGYDLQIVEHDDGPRWQIVGDIKWRPRRPRRVPDDFVSRLSTSQRIRLFRKELEEHQMSAQAFGQPIESVDSDSTTAVQLMSITPSGERA
jgi:hypothetical protein